MRYPQTLLDPFMVTEALVWFRSAFNCRAGAPAAWIPSIGAPKSKGNLFETLGQGQGVKRAL